ncbi:MAG: pyridoxamine 5'-phosphate oxidase family protein [Acidimicrobiia bacterium]
MTDVQMVELSYDECLDHLRSERVGRIAVIADCTPLVFPVNYRLVEDELDGPARHPVWVALRTRTGNPIDRAAKMVAFEIDGVDHAHQRGWSVLVSGMLHPVDEEAAEFGSRFDPGPWLGEDRDRWLVIEPMRITGRRISDAESGWAFSTAAYL